MADSKRILFLTPQLPFPPEQGGAIRNYHLIAQASTRYRIGILSLTEGEPLPEHLAALRAVCDHVETVPAPVRTRGQRLRDLFTTREPDMARRLATDAYASALRRLLALEHYDIVQVEGMEMACYGLLIPDWPDAGAPAVVFDDLNAEFLLQRRACLTDLRRPRRWPQAAYSAIQSARLRRYERLVCERADATVAVSELDAEAIAGLAWSVTPLVVPNGVDTQGYRVDLPDILPLRHPNLVFTGKMDFRPNVDAMRWFCAEAWPEVRRNVPGVHLYIVGKQPHAEVQALAQDADITVTGYVPDILPYFGGADVYIVPLRVGGGTRLKVLEAMASGLAMVSTRLGAEGIDLTHGEHAMLADTPSDFAEATVRLLQDPALRQALGARARAQAEARYDWRQIVPRLYSLYERL
jgi:sugar transferase (PEP-CTERM/EpsH1 system associated)